MKDSVQTFLYIAIIFLGSIFTLICLWDYEEQIKDLEKDLETQVDSLNCTIDSLLLEIDTLTWKTEIWDFNIRFNTTHLLSAIISVESRDNDSAHAVGEDAVGCLQIRKTMVNDVNRILKRQGSGLRFTYDDRWMRTKSIQMFDIYCKHYGLITAEEIARCWNGGPRGMDKEATSYYWEKVKEELNS
jgi:uncharacterized FlaG/YvyC family protein